MGRESLGWGWKEMRSKDMKINGDGKLFVEKLEVESWMILNGGVIGDEEGNWTYMGPNGQSVIDYVIRNEDVRQKIERLDKGSRVESDHR